MRKEPQARAEAEDDDDEAVCVGRGRRGTGDDGRPLGPLARRSGEAEALAEARQSSPTSVPGPAAPTRGNSRCHCCRWVYVYGLLSRLFVVRLLAAVVAKSGCLKFVATILGKPFWGAWLGDNWANLVSRK